jgi:hypothetical protein
VEAEPQPEPTTPEPVTPLGVNIHPAQLSIYALMAVGRTIEIPFVHPDSKLTPEEKGAW